MTHYLLFDSLLSPVFLVIPIVLLVGAIYTWLRYKTIKKANLTVHFFDEVIRTLFVCYITALLTILLVPTNFWNAIWYFLVYGRSGVTVGKLFTFEYNFIPSIISYLNGSLIRDSWSDLIYWENIILFLPMGLLLPYVSSKVKWHNILPTTLCIILSIEVMQLVVGRCFDVDDLIFDTLGSLCGFALAMLIVKSKQPNT